jgi:hypothetical protein
MSEYLKVPKDCFIDRRKMGIIDREYTLNKIWSIGGDTGWYYGDWLWDLRGFIDKLSGVRWTEDAPIKDIHAGDVLDFLARIMLIKKKEISFVC